MGVGGRWNAYITWHGKQYFLGSFPRKDAAEECIRKAREAKNQGRLKEFYYENLAADSWQFKPPYQWNKGRFVDGYRAWRMIRMRSYEYRRCSSSTMSLGSCCGIDREDLKTKSPVKKSARREMLTDSIDSLR